MNEPRPVAIIVPVDQEFEPYRALVSDLTLLEAGPWRMYRAGAGKQPLILILCDVGPANAGAATERVIALHNPAAVLHGGSAGAHNLALLPGDVVVGERYVVLTTRSNKEARLSKGFRPSLMRYRRGDERVHLDFVPADPNLYGLALRLADSALARFGAWDAGGWPEGVATRPGHAVPGVIGSSEAWTVDPEELRWLRAEFGAECEDMESAYIAQVCAMHGVPFLAVRAISNNEVAGVLGPGEVMAAIGAAGARAAAVLTSIAAALAGEAATA